MGGSCSRSPGVLKRYVEQQELTKVQEIWSELTANVSYAEEPLPLSLQERGEVIIDQLQALTLQTATS